MKANKRLFVILFLIVISISLIFSACGKTDNSSTDTSKSTTAATTTKKATESNEEKITVTMFMGNSGLPHPQGVDPSDNEFIKIVEDYANVDLVLEVPTYEDFGTKFSLLLSSGKLPDLIHTWYRDDANKAGESGAFLDLKAYYDNSEVIQKYITDQMMELAKTTSGHYFRIPMASDATPQGYGVYTRYDLLQKYNNGEWPGTVEEWVDYLRKIKKEIPDSVPISCHNSTDSTFAYGQTFFAWYGAMPYDFRVQDGVSMSTFVLPEYRAAVELFKQLYQEGILDKEFATNNQDKRIERIQINNTVLMSDGADQLFGMNQYYRAIPGCEDFVFAFAPPLDKYPDILKDVKYAQYGTWPPINSHGLYISAASKNPDRVWRVIEGFASDELYEAIFWGKEGSEYVVTNGERIPDSKKLTDPARFWSLHLALVFGFGSGQESKMANLKQMMGEEAFNIVSDSLKPLAEQAKEVGMSVTTYANRSEFAGVDEKYSESNQFITQATVQAVMGVISMDDFDKKVSEYKEKYGFIADAYTNYIKENKEDLIKKGVNDAGW